MKTLILSLMGFLIPILGFAQWTDDPTVNTFVAGTGMDYSCPKIVASPDGNFFISSLKYVPDTNINYERWLQNLDHEGTSLWGANGILVSNYPNRMWFSEYSLACDAEGNAVIAFDNMRGGSGFSHVSVYKIAPDGHAVWDTNGIQLNTGDYDSYYTMMTITPGNNVLVAWWGELYIDDTIKRFIKIRKISPEGNLKWSHPLTVANPDSNYLFPNILPVGDDDFILIWQRKFEEGTGVGRMWYSYIYAMRYDSAGNEVWPQKARICDHGDSAYVMPEFFRLFPVQDPDGGIYVAWFDDRYKTDYSNIYFQHVDADGALKWPMNGLPVSHDNMGYERVEPWMRYDPATGNLYLFWEEYRAVGIYDSFGMLGQKTGPDGSLKWGDLGKIFAGFTMDTIWYIEAVKPIPDHDMLILVDQEYDSIIPPDTVQFDQLFAIRIDSMGSMVWSPQQVLMAATQGTKYYPDMSDLSEDMFVVSWNENRDSPFWPEGTVYAQNISLDGKLGPMGVPFITGQESDLLLYPNPTDGVSWLKFKKPVAGMVEMEIFNPYGQRISAMSLDLESENYTIRLSAESLPSGFYLIRIRSNGEESLVKWLVLK